MSDRGGTERDLAFVSYSHADQEWLERFLILLKPYVRKGRLRIWADPYINAGERWERKIEEALRRSRVGLLLLSPNFAASDFIAEVELPTLRAAAEAGTLTLFGVPVSSLDPDTVDLREYQWARPPSQALDLLGEPERNRALVEITRTLVALFQREDERRLETAAEAPPATGLATVVVEPLSRDGTQTPGTLHGVPDYPPHFVPRASALASLRQSLLEQAVPRHGISAAARAGLHGQGGIGKTVLATAVCRDDEVRRAFPDGVHWLTLGQEPDLVGLQRSLLRQTTGQDGDVESVNLGVVALRDALERKRCLLVLDDAWQAAHAAAFDALGPRGRLLVTTRDREILRALDAPTQDVEVLPEPDALDLLAAWAREPRASLPAAAADVARECGHLPLALSLAGARIGEGARWDDLLQALRDGNLEFLDHAHGSVFKSLSLSVRALPPAEAARYHDLAVFPEDVSVPEAIVVRLWQGAGLGEADARALLERFASKALLFLTGGEGTRAVRFHDLQGDYLRLTAGDLPAAHARLLDACQETIPGRQRGPALWSSLFAGETYLWQHLFHHLLGAGRRDEADAIVRDRRWLAAKIAATAVSSLLADLSALVERAPSEANRRIERALRLEAGWLHIQPRALEGLIYNRLVAEGSSAADIERLIPGLHPPVRLARRVNLGGGRVFRGHSDSVVTCAYSPDGSRILSGSGDYTLREWDRASGRELHCFQGHTNTVTACAYSPDGSRLFSASSDRSLREWERGSKREVRRFQGSVKGSACACSPDGAHVLSVGDDRSFCEWDRASGDEVRRFKGHQGRVFACVYSSDGSRILSASNDATLREWDRASGGEICRFEGHLTGVRCCAYSPDGTRVLSTSSDGTVREWDRVSGREVRRFEGHSREVNACAYSPDGARVLSASDDRTLREWDRLSGDEVRRFEGHSREVKACAYSPDGTRILSASVDRTLREWDLTSSLPPRLQGHSEPVTACVVSPDGSRVLSASDDGTLREWSLASGDQVSRFEWDLGALGACAYSPDGSRILFASWDNVLREWDGATTQELIRFDADARVTACAWSPDGTRILAGAGDGTLVERDRASGKERRFKGHIAAVVACVYSRDGSRVLSASWDETVREWDRASRKELRCFEGHTRGVRACAYSPDGERVLSASTDQTLREWHRDSGRELRRFEGHSLPVSGCTYATDGSHIVSVSWDNTLRIWSARDGRCVHTVYGAFAFNSVAVAAGHIAAGDALGNVWLLACDWF